MGKTNLTKKTKTAGVFLRLTPDFKKKAQIYAVKNDTTLTDLIIESLIDKMKSK